MTVLLANLDCEAEWAGHHLSQKIRRRLAPMAALFRSIVDAPAVELSLGDSHPEGVRATSFDGALPTLCLVGGSTGAGHTSPSERGVLPWGATGKVPTPTMPRLFGPCAQVTCQSGQVPVSRAVSDRRFCVNVREEMGLSLPSTAIATTSADAIEATRSMEGWVAKAPLSAAGRERVIGRSEPTPHQAQQMDRLLARFGALVIEPWLERITDYGVCAAVASSGEVTGCAPHTLLTTKHGGFLGVHTDPKRVPFADELAAVAADVGKRLFTQGYRGPFSIDAFVYRKRGAVRLHPLCEINPRWTFGWVAHAIAARTGDPVVDYSSLFVD